MASVTLTLTHWHFTFKKQKMLRQYRKFESGEFIVVGVDTASGGPDYCVAQFLSKSKLDVPLVYHAHILATEMTPVIFEWLEKIYDTTNVQPLVAYERNNGGVFEMERLASLNKKGKFRVFTMPTFGSIANPIAKKLGWDTNTATRPKMLSDLKEAVDHKLMKIYDRLTIDEMFSFIVSQTSTAWKAQAEKGAHDDLVMSLAIAWQLQQSDTFILDDDEEFPDDTKKFGTDGFY